MRDLGTKMSELKFEAPLAKFEEGEEWAGSELISNLNNINNSLYVHPNESILQNTKICLLEEVVCDANVSKNGLHWQLPNSTNCNSLVAEMCIENGSTLKATVQEVKEQHTDKRFTNGETMDNFTETFGGSLEDLVNTFDERITKCFGNFEENVEALAPVQVRSQEEIINECQMWWTITGNFGNILPIDWSKSYTRQMHIPTLKLFEKGDKECDFNKNINNRNIEVHDLSMEDEAIANDLDMHALILNGLNADSDEPVKSVEEVIKEIDDIMDEVMSSTEETNNCDSEAIEKAKEVLNAPLFSDKLKYLSLAQLNEFYLEMEVLIQELSETLINELALRDELEYEKELKNSFISLLLSVQNKRRQYHVEKKRGKFQGPEPKYLTTVIPYHLENNAQNNQSLQVLIKVLKAINEDSPTVPTLLTDYILKVLCPT